MKKISLIIIVLMCQFTAQAENVKALVGGMLIDGFKDHPIQNSVVIIRDDKIVAVGQKGQIEIPQDAEIISTEGMTVLPGLWDMHVHLQINGHADYKHWHSTYPPRFEKEIMPASAHQLLMAGVTSARDLGAPLETIINVRDAINRGDIPGPTMYVSGPFIQKKPYPGTELYRWGVDGAKDARAKVKKLADAGVDVIKLIDQDQMSEAELMAVVDEAHKNNIPVVAHAHRPEEILLGLKAGVDNFEHTGLSTAPEYPPAVIAGLRERAAQMNIGPLFWTPTVEGLFNYDYVKNNTEKLDNDSWHLDMPQDIIDDIKGSIQHPDQLPYYQITSKRKPTLKRKFQQLIDAGVVLMVGTDSGIPLKFHSQSTWNEMDIWVREMGVSPMDTIRGATYWPSVMMKVSDQVGTITPGKYADIIAVKGDVLRYMNLLQRVDMVFKHGKRVK
ncbi:amidohydrolase family protein [Marinicella litoralis]|uniref:Imidazolonepropionase-like amidohydrolase n=1 Tax=Marinicella litoralis TaxID=644220 RepID=A0A4R6XQA2_9GAMM|nr:amidohydrolase family protein [Marinicella litoralis]TDR20370.1 imidazolonepropionase-like amidohydrolase [Marinicella litoralis]